MISKYLKLSCLIAATTFAIISCKKDSDGAPDYPSGNPQSSGITPGEASGGIVITMKGTGLGSMTSIVFDKNNVPATFMPTLNTDQAIVFRVPDTAFGGPQNIVFTNKEGKSLSVPFKVIALPTVSAANTYDFEAGTTITLTGNNLDDVTSVKIDGTTDEATIVSKSRKEMVITMPSTSVNRAKLNITNSSGNRVTDLEFTNMPNAFAVFTEGFVTGMQDWSWASVHEVANNVGFMSNQSIHVIYSSGSWSAVSLHKNDPKLNVSDYSYLTFWIKGGTVDTQMDVYSENGGSKKTISVPANVWTYFKLPIQGYMDGVALERLDFQIHGPNGGDQSMYIDNILFVK